MNYDEEISNLYKEIADLKTWLLQNTPSINEFQTLQQKYDRIIETVVNRLMALEQKVKFLEQ